MSLEVGQVLGGQYLIERVVGRGTMGLVYKGRDTKLGSTVAIRLILPEFDNEQVPAFFENEAKVVGQLNCENIARLYNMGFLPTGERCLVGEYVEGEVLQRRIRRVGHMSELTVAQLLIQLLESLSVAHEAGVVHRDLTPSSIFIVSGSDGADAIKMIDFGMSRLQLLTANPGSPPAAIISEIQSFQYLSPEQLNGLREIDPRSNIYSLGVIAYEAITGRLPFEGKDFGDLTFNILQGDPPSVEELAPESSSPFSQLISKAMARTPNARFQYAEEMYAAISNWAIRAGISKSKLESGVSDWPRRDVEVPVMSERPSRVPSPGASPAPLTPVIDSESETQTSDSEAMGATAREASPSLPNEAREPASLSSPEDSSFKEKEPFGVDYFANPPPPPTGLAEEDALFAIPPTAPRDELPFVSIDVLTTDAAVVSDAHTPVERSPLPAELPRVEPSPSSTPAWREPTPPVVTDETRPVVTSPSLTHEEEPADDEAQDSSFRRAQTILGIGGVAVRPALKSDPNNGVVVRGPQSVEPGVPPSVPSSPAPEPAPFRPRQETVPGIIPLPDVIEPVMTEPATTEPATTEPAATVPATTVPATTEPAATEPAVAPSFPTAEPVPVAAPSVSTAEPVPAEKEVPAPSPVAAPQDLPQTAPVAAAPQAPPATKAAIVPTDLSVTKPAVSAATSAGVGVRKPAGVAAAIAVDEVEIPVEFRRGRSKKAVVLAVVLIGLGAAGAAAVLLQKNPETTRELPTSAPTPSVAASVVVSPAPEPSVAPVRPSSSADTVAGAEAKPSSGVADLASAARKASSVAIQSGPSTASSVRAATTPTPKSPKPTKPVQVSQPTGPTQPAKPPVNRGSASKDPYNYR